VCTRPEREPGVDDDRDRVVALPRRADPERAGSRGSVKRPPALRPVLGNVVLLCGAERARDPGSAEPVRVRGELELVPALPLLEAFGRELEHERARLLCPVERHAHRDSAEAAQRKALFSFSKKPSSGR
jgi:hypothetical protein